MSIIYLRFRIFVKQQVFSIIIKKRMIALTIIDYYANIITYKHIKFKERIMKKKILVAFIAVIALVCLFTIAVSAKTVTYEGQEIELVDNLGDPSWYTGNTALAIQDKESFVILKDSEGNMTAFPSYYILRFGVDVKDGVVTNAYVLWDDQNGVDYSFINDKLGTSYAYGSIYYIEFPYGMTCCKNNRLFGRENGGAKETGIVEIVLPDSVNTIEGQAFRMMDNCKKINIPAAVTSLPSWAFCGSTMLETVVIAEGSLIESTGNSFSNCTALSSINIEACTNLKTLGGSAFENCTSLRRISLPDSIETISAKAFYKIGEFELASDYLPTSLKTIGTHFLSGCNIQNDVLYFPEGFTDFSAQFHFNDGAKYEGTGFTLVFLGKMTAVRIDSMDANTYFKGLQIIFAQNTADEVNGKFLAGTTYNGNHAYIAKDSTGALAINKEVTTGTLTLTLRNNDPNSNGEAGTDANGNKVYSINSITPRFIFCGGNDVDLIYQVRNSISGWNYYLTTPFDYDVDAHKTAGVHYDKIQVVNEVNCGYDGLTTNTCVVCDNVAEKIVPATGDHKYTVDEDCTTAHDCTVCLKEMVAALSHETSFTIAYENGYILNGTKTTFCTNEGCAHEIVEDAPALFISVGYSSPEYLEGCIVHTVIANKNAIYAYQENSDKKIEYGVVAAIHADGKPVEVAEDGTIVGRGQAIIAKMTNTNYSRIEIKLMGVGAGIEVNCNAYIVVDNKVGYICGDEVLETAVSKTI